MSEEKNIQPDDQSGKLPGYLSGKMEDAEQHAFERSMEDDPFLADAVEGLQSLPQNNISNIVQQLNSDLKKQVQKKKSRRNKRKLQEQPWLYFTIILLLILIVVAYLVISRL